MWSLSREAEKVNCSRYTLSVKVQKEKLTRNHNFRLIHLCNPINERADFEMVERATRFELATPSLGSLYSTS